MREKIIRGAGLVAAILYATLIVAIYTRQPGTFAQISGGLSATIGAYQVNQAEFREAVSLFHADRFAEARAAFRRADPAERDPPTQFYIAYSYYREGWGRFYSDDALFAEGLKALDQAVAHAPGGRVDVADPKLKLHSADALRVELEAGLRRDASDFNPLRVFGERK